MPYARVCGLLAATFVMSPIVAATAAPPEDTRSSRSGVNIPSVTGVVRPLSCRIEGATATVPGANLYVRNDSTNPIPAGTKIQWKAGPEVHSGIYTLGVALAPGDSKMLTKVYDKECSAAIVP